MESTGQSATEEAGQSNLDAVALAEERHAFRARFRALHAEAVRELSDAAFDDLYHTASRLGFILPLVLRLEWLRRANEGAPART